MAAIISPAAFRQVGALPASGGRGRSRGRPRPCGRYAVGVEHNGIAAAAWNAGLRGPGFRREFTEAFAQPHTRHQVRWRSGWAFASLSLSAFNAFS